MEFHSKVCDINLPNKGLIIFILSIVIPGWSTIIAGFLAGKEFQ